MDEGFTVIETALAATVVLIVFGLSSSAVLFLWEGYLTTSRQAEVVVVARHLSDILANDIRSSRDVRDVAEGWELLGRQGKITMYSADESSLYRNGLVVSAELIVDSLEITPCLETTSESALCLVEYSLVLSHAQDSLLTHRLESRALTRLAPMWDTAGNLMPGGH